MFRGTTNKISSTLDLWRDPAQRSLFPLLHLNNYRLSILFPFLLKPSEPERVFSGAGKVLKNSRSSPHMESIQATSVSEILGSELSLLRNQKLVHTLTYFNHVLHPSTHPCQNLNQPREKLIPLQQIVLLSC